mmetsp:Transcript_117868/g.186680  ORF Transcript_117868/g.186680 Transcript_117868/m.186680 type:complete len:117 (+) Transcript_117868:145-495(+)
MRIYESAYGVFQLMSYNGQIMKSFGSGAPSNSPSFYQPSLEHECLSWVQERLLVVEAPQLSAAHHSNSPFWIPLRHHAPQQVRLPTSQQQELPGLAMTLWLLVLERASWQHVRFPR